MLAPTVRRLLLLGLLPLLLATGTALSGAPAVAETASGRITGTISTSAGSSPAFLGVQVLVRDPTFSSWRVVGNTRASASGAYAVEGLTPGTYRVCTSNPPSVVLDGCFGGASNVYSATDVTVTAGQATTGVDIAVSAPSHLTGAVSGPAGADLSQVVAEVYEVDEYGLERLREELVAPSGDYDLLLPAGTYRVCFYDRGGAMLNRCVGPATNVRQARDLPLGSADSVSLGNLRLVAASQITGTVTGPPGSDLSNVGVVSYALIPASGKWKLSAYFDVAADGGYRLGGQRAGTYRVCVTDYSRVLPTTCFADAVDLETATDVVLGKGQIRSGIDVAMAAPSHITGRVSGPSGEPVAGVQVAAYRLIRGQWGWVSSAETDSAGRYDVAGLAADTYRLCFRASSAALATQCYSGAVNVLEATDVVVGRGRTVAGRNVQLKPAAHLAGTVTGPSGRPLSDIFVAVYARVGGRWTYLDRISTTAQGSYDVGGLPGGTYRLCFDDDNDNVNLAEECWDDAPTVKTAKNIVVASGATASGRNARLAALPAAAR